MDRVPKIQNQLNIGACAHFAFARIAAVFDPQILFSPLYTYFFTRYRENKPFDKSGTGSVADLYFVGYQGNVLYVLQSAADSTSRILRDFSGGNLGTDVKIVGDFVAPGNFGMTSMAFANVNMGITVGNVHGSYAYIGKVRPA